MPSAVQPGVEGGGVGHLLLGDVVGEVTQGSCTAGASRRTGARWARRTRWRSVSVSARAIRSAALGVGEVEAATQRTVSQASSRAIAAVLPGVGVARVGVRWKPPNRTLTGWMAPAPEQFDYRVAGLLQAQSALDVRPV